MVQASSAPWTGFGAGADWRYRESDGGATFQDLHLTGTASFQVTHTDDFAQQRRFSVEMLSLTLSGSGGSGGTLLLRESPTKASLGRLSVEPNGDGFRINSFFDIFTEISLDGGTTWFPSAESTRVEQQLLPASRRQ